MLAVGGTVELGLDVDAWGCGKGEAMADVDVPFRWGCEWGSFCVDGRSVAGFYGGLSNFADGLLELWSG